MSEQSTAVSVRAFTDEELYKINSFEDAIALLNSKGLPGETIADYGTGFTVLNDKSTLVGVGFVIVSFRFNTGDYGDDGFVSAEIVTKHNEKLILNDGSVGILRQLREVERRRNEAGYAVPFAGLAVPNGLAKTDYFYNSVTKETANRPGQGKDWVPATTYYLAQ